jgi:hypothetical protein
MSPRSSGSPTRKMTGDIMLEVVYEQIKELLPLIQAAWRSSDFLRNRIMKQVSLTSISMNCRLETLWRPMVRLPVNSEAGEIWESR